MDDEDVVVDDDEPVKTWEGEYERTWGAIKEDEAGTLQTFVAEMQQQQKRRRIQRETGSFRRGIIRHVYLVVDMSRAMDEKDLSPSRGQLTIQLVKEFVAEFFDQNPISQLGILFTRDANVEKISELSGNPHEQIRAIDPQDNVARVPPRMSGEPSIQKSLSLALALLNHVPRHGSREVVCLIASLTSSDPGNLFTTIDELKREGVRCSVIGLAAEVRVFRLLAERTNGSYGVILKAAHYRELLMEHIYPPLIVDRSAEPALVRMGFPVRKNDRFSAICLCHQEPRTGGFQCPRCRGVVCELPMDCPICGLTLISSPHLGRSYHHLFPVPQFQERAAADRPCYACTHALAAGESAFECPNCERPFCVDCDIFIHDVLHNCPGCLAKRL